jgi:hypothetical protein
MSFSAARVDDPCASRSEARASIGVGIHPDLGVSTCAGNEDGSERDRDDSDTISYCHALAESDDRSGNVFALDDRRADRG